MSDRSKFVFTSETMPVLYDELLVPRLFQPWAESLVQQLEPPIGGRALDVATGPGTVARVLASVIGPRGVVAGCDSSATMIARAEAKGDVPNGAPIAYTVAPAAPLPYPDGSFDAVTCQQGLQFFPDAHAALAEMLRVLGPKGRLAASVWRPLADCSVFRAYADALTAAGCHELAELMATPFPLWNGTELAERARTAGFRKAEVVSETREVIFPDGLEGVLAAIGATPIGPLIGALDDVTRARIKAEARTSFAALTVGGKIRGPMTSWVLLAKT